MSRQPPRREADGGRVKRGAHPLLLVAACAALIASAWGLSIAVASTVWWLGLARWTGTISCLVTGAFVLSVLYWVANQHFAGRNRRWGRVHEGQCIWCGYDLRESQGHCPECGKQIPEWLYRVVRESKRNARRPKPPAPASRTGG